jgi:ATP-dependent Clp protease ATP-binding subunit ClpA
LARRQYFLPFFLSLGQGHSSSEARDAVMAAVRGAFTPELLNRIDEIVLFNRLSHEDMDSIVNIQLKGTPLSSPFRFRFLWKA